MDPRARCVLLANRHHGLSEGVRGLLETCFDTVFIVGDESSLLEGAQRLHAPVIIVDLAFAAGDLPSLIGRIVGRSPQSKIVVLTVYDSPNIADFVLRAGAHGVVLKSRIATDLLVAVDELRAGRTYSSPVLSHS